MTLYDRLFLLPLACLLAAPACIIVADDDSGDSGNDSTPTTNDDTGPATSGATSAATGDTAAEDETAADDTAGQGCGWGPTGDEQVPDGYVCGGDGADPAGMFDLACPEGVILEVGGDCGNIPGPGCCGPAGDAWFCGQGAEGPELARLDC